MPSTYSIESVTVLPAIEDDSFCIEVMDSDGNDAVGCSVSVGSTRQLTLRLTTFATFRGHINHMVVFIWKGQVDYSSTSSSVSSCALGVLIRGSIMDKTQVAMCNSTLSIDAKAFIPMEATTYFDDRVRKTERSPHVVFDFF